MKIFALILLFCCVSLSARTQQGGLISAAAASTFAQGTLQSVQNATVRAKSGNLVLDRLRSGTPILLVFSNCRGVGVEREANQWWVQPTEFADTPIHTNTGLWILPEQPDSANSSWHLDLMGADVVTTKTADGLSVSLPMASVTLEKALARPHSDPFGHRFSLQIEGGPEFEDALAAFYWGTMLPSVVEKTMASRFPYSSGYVLSTLNVQSYAGSYPAVDHEFQIKGRLAMGTDVDLDIARRMIDLQFRLMNDDPERLSRSPTSVQPDGRREYHIRRDSKDSHQNAAMFPLTANIEVLEESWLYYSARKDKAWLRQNIANLENAAGWTLQNVDQYGRVWSDVYYEDQVIKDGRETEAQAFAAFDFQLLSRMEAILDRQDKADRYRGISRKLTAALIAPLPMGYWNNDRHRFVDWVDRNAEVHDHIPLLANTLPVTLGYASDNQAHAVRELVQSNAGEFERFPSFVSADIAAYDASEMGTAGPYDLSAAGRYWFWDAAYRQGVMQNDVLFQQLKAVAAEGKRTAYLMGERYDMDHVYYVDGKPAHGAEKYYEYPNVYAAVLINKYLGVSSGDDADVNLTPHLQGDGTVELQQPLYSVRYTLQSGRFTLINLSDQERSFSVDLSATSSRADRYFLQTNGQRKQVGQRSTLRLARHQEATWFPNK